MNHRLLLTAGALLLLGACGGYGSAPAAPSAPTTGGNAMAIAITGINGSQSFNPNPASIKVGAMVTWHNSDNNTHHIVQDNAGGGPVGGVYDPADPSANGFDAGQTPPGTDSATLTAQTAGVIHYHCSIHPSMVGTLSVTP